MDEEPDDHVIGYGGAKLSRRPAPESEPIAPPQRHQQQNASLFPGPEDRPLAVTGPPEGLRQLIPNIDELWDPRLSLALNISRVVSGEAGPARGTPQQPNIPLLGATRPGRGSGSGTGELAPRNGHSDGFGGDFKDIVRALRKPEPQNLESPLLALQKQVVSVFKHGPLRAGGMFQELSVAAEAGVSTAETPVSNLPVPWNSCKAAATLVGLLACPSARLYEVLKFQSQRLNGLPTYEDIANTPSTSLRTAFKQAKALARGEEGTSSLLVVSLIDVHIFELARQGKSQDYTSFAHTFVLGIGPEGVIIWQGWGEHGYGLDEYINKGQARVRSWQEAGDFVDVFENFTAYKVSGLCISPDPEQWKFDANTSHRGSGMRSATSCTRNASTSTSSRSVEPRGRRGRSSRKQNPG